MHDDKVPVTQLHFNRRLRLSGRLREDLLQLGIEFGFFDLPITILPCQLRALLVHRGAGQHRVALCRYLARRTSFEVFLLHSDLHFGAGAQGKSRNGGAEGFLSVVMELGVKLAI